MKPGQLQLDQLKASVVKKKNDKKNYLANQYRVFSITYATFFCLIGVTLITIEPFKACTKCENYLKILIECFFIFMHTLSVIWVMVMFVLISVATNQRKVAIKSSTTGLNRRLSHTPRPRFSRLSSIKNKSSIMMKSLKNRDSTISEESDFDVNELDNIYGEKKGDLASAENGSINLSNGSQAGKNSSSGSSYSPDVTKFYFTYDYENGTGELYMRVGTAIFAMCALIDRCLSLIQMIETYVSNPTVLHGCRVTFVVSIIAKFTSIFFIFAQTFFIFKYANIIINYGKNSAVVGLMHIVCTNFCVFFRTVVMETVAEMKHLSHVDHDHHNNSSTSFSGHKTPFKNETSEYDDKTYGLDEIVAMYSQTDNAHKTKLVESLEFTSNISAGVQEAQSYLSAYLYPCIIEYSLMCITVFYILWSSIEQRYSVHNHSGTWVTSQFSFDGTPGHGNHDREVRMSRNTITSQTGHITPISMNNRSTSEDKRRVHQFIVDCSKSTSGLFQGIIVLLFTLISLITYYVYKTRSPLMAIRISLITGFSLITLSLLVSVLIFIKFKRVEFGHKLSFEMGYNQVLTVVGLGGIFMFGIYSIVALLDHGLHSDVEILSFCIQIVSMIEASVQSVVIIDGLEMHAKTRKVQKSKPARSLITLLLLIDVSLWLSDTFSVKKYEMNTIQLDYYGYVFWSIVSSISNPLAIFFRFHASVCLSDIWKTLYDYEESNIT